MSNSKLNYNFARINGASVDFAPATLVIDGLIISNPTAEQYLAAGWKRYYNDYPSESPSEGYMWYPDGYRETETEIHKLWTQVEVPPPVPDPETEA